ncbi:MAG: winged helix-turn-helix domain-containing protein [Nitrososphaerales archaeon]
MPIDRADFVLSSDTRLKILAFLSKNGCTPTQLALGIQKHLSHISRALRELESKELVSCLNPENSKPRVYHLTSDGDRLMREIDRYRFRLKIE